MIEDASLDHAPTAVARSDVPLSEPTGEASREFGSILHRKTLRWKARIPAIVKRRREAPTSEAATLLPYFSFLRS